MSDKNARVDQRKPEGGKRNKRNPTGRPRFIMDWKKFDLACAAQCTLEEIAVHLKCSEDTIERLVLKEKKMSFADYFEIKRKASYTSLRAKMFTEAMNGNTALLIFLAKNWLGMKDRQDVGGSVRHYHSWIEDLPDDQLSRMAGYSPMKVIIDDNGKRSKTTH